MVDPKFDLTERVAILFMRQIVDAVQFIHTQNILHLDLKVRKRGQVSLIASEITIDDLPVIQRKFIIILKLLYSFRL